MVKDINGKNVILRGQKTVVVFNGSYDERLGDGDNLSGKGAILANVTVYDSGGADDVQKYKVFTMSSDPSKYGIVADGDYNVSRIGNNEKPGPFGSEWTLNNRGRVPAWGDFNPAFPSRNPAYLDGVFIHRSNNNGWAGERWDNNKKRWTVISKGCLLVLPNQWETFNNQLNSIDKLLLQLRRK